MELQQTSVGSTHLSFRWRFRKRDYL